MFCIYNGYLTSLIASYDTMTDLVEGWWWITFALTFTILLTLPPSAFWYSGQDIVVYMDKVPDLQKLDQVQWRATKLVTG